MLNGKLLSLRSVLVFTLWASLLPGASVLAHEIPSDVTVQMYVKPEAAHLEVLLRVPLAAMRDFEFVVRGPGYLDLDRLDPQLEDAVRLWLLNDLRFFADGVPLAEPALAATRVALPSDRAFAAYESAQRAVFTERLPAETNLYWEQALLDVALRYPLSDADPATAEFEVLPTFARLGLTTLTRISFLSEAGLQETGLQQSAEPRVLAFTGDPGRVSLDPGALDVFARFLVNGFEHVLDGMDHLLFLFTLVIPLLLIRPLIVVITAFTLAHSITLGAAVFELVPTGLWFGSFVELAIAVSILYMAVENLLGTSVRRRWLVAFGFGLAHGFGFSFALQETLQFAGERVPIALLGFNLGIEFGQLLVLVLVVPLLRLAGRWLPRRGLGIVLSALIGHTAWHWLIEHWTELSAYSLSAPTLDTGFGIGAMRWLMLLLVAAFLVWLLRPAFERWSNQG